MGAAAVLLGARLHGRFGGRLVEPDLRGVVLLARGLRGPGPAPGDVVKRARGTALLGLVLLALDLLAQRVEPALLARLEGLDQPLPSTCLVGALVVREVARPRVRRLQTAG